jgi:hypothetical protein
MIEKTTEPGKTLELRVADACRRNGRRQGRPRRRASVDRRQYVLLTSGQRRSLGTLVPLLMAAYKRRLREIVKVVPTWVSEEILSASEHIGDDRAVLWMSKN